MSDGKSCDRCDKFFSEFDLDRINGEWLCRDCENKLETTEDGEDMEWQ